MNFFRYELPDVREMYLPAYGQSMGYLSSEAHNLANPLIKGVEKFSVFITNGSNYGKIRVIPHKEFYNEKENGREELCVFTLSIKKTENKITKERESLMFIERMIEIGALTDIDSLINWLDIDSIEMSKNTWFPKLLIQTFKKIKKGETK